MSTSTKPKIPRRVGHWYRISGAIRLKKGDIMNSKRNLIDPRVVYQFNEQMMDNIGGGWIDPDDVVGDKASVYTMLLVIYRKRI